MQYLLRTRVNSLGNCTERGHNLPVTMPGACNANIEWSFKYLCIINLAILKRFIGHERCYTELYKEANRFFYTRLMRRKIILVSFLI